AILVYICSVSVALAWVERHSGVGQPPDDGDGLLPAADLRFGHLRAAGVPGVANVVADDRATRALAPGEGRRGGVAVRAAGRGRAGLVGRAARSAPPPRAESENAPPHSYDPSGWHARADVGATRRRNRTQAIGCGRWRPRSRSRPTATTRRTAPGPRPPRAR